ncbi:autophagy-related protein 13-domain-containing protein [Phlebopus sp. FC_14]|nr:autophagy-related protein 13-domain-containing protein [Phlebopus sp. FC_14]
MSNDIQKADQIAHRFYTKLCLVVGNARTTAEPRSQTKVDKWFNLETPDSDMFKDHLRSYRAVSSSPTPPPFELQVLLSIPELTTNQVLVYLSPDSSRVRIDPTPQHILLENWLLNFTPSFPYTRYDDQPGDVAPSTIYKHGIPLFRSLFSLLRILPSWKLFNKLRRRMRGPYRNGNMSIQLRIKGLDDGLTNILGFDTPPAPNSPPLPFETHTFPAIPHPMGTLSLTAKYLTSPNFQLDELESLLSSRFLSLDEGPDFTPTLIKNQQRDSMSGLPGSLPLRTSLPKSPPSSVAGQFVLPPTHSRTDSLPGSQSPRTAAVPMSRTPTNVVPSGSTSALSITSSRPEGSTAWSKDEGLPPSSLAARLRRESISTTGRSSVDLPSAPGALPIRRPSINPVHPFKSSTLSSGSPSIHSPSPSLRQPSPLSTGVALPSLPSRPVQTSPNSSRVPPSPIAPGRPSPPFAPSSLGDRRSLTSAEGEDSSPSRPPPRKRYSSSFGHRYAASGGAGSEGSPGSAGERKEGERERQGASYLGANTDDDEISIFVQEIDARKPLSSISRQQLPTSNTSRSTSSPGASGRHVPLPRISDAGSDMPIGDSGEYPPRRSLGGVGDAGGDSQRSSLGPVLTGEAEVGGELDRMREVFLASLEGLGSGSTRRRDQSSGAKESGGSDVESQSRADSRSEDVLGGRGEGLAYPSRPRLASGRSMSANGIASSGGSAEVIGRLELDEDSRRRR